MPPRLADGPGRYARPSAGHPAVQALVDRLVAGGDPVVTDLGGTMSLNLHVPAAGVVLRVHPPFVTRRRLVALRSLRHQLADAGLVVGNPVACDGSDAVGVAGWLAEVETHVPHSKPPPTWESYVWMFHAMGELHRVTAASSFAVPRPEVSTYGPPSTLRRSLDLTAGAVGDDAEVGAMVEWTRRMVRALDAQWVPAPKLPNLVIHGDIRLANVGATPGGAAAYLDFGFSARRPRIHDLAYSLSWIVLRPDDSGTAETFAWDRVPELVDAYEAGATSRLEPIEHRALGPYLASVPLYLAAVAGYTPDPAATVRGEAPFLRIAEWVLANPHAIASVLA